MRSLTITDVKVSQESQWSSPFDVNSVGVNGVVTIDDQVDSIRNKEKILIKKL